MHVGIRELKSKLSEYVATASAGTAITVTDRGRPVAQLVPVAGQVEFERGLKEGWIEPARRTKLGEPPLVDAAVSTSELLDDDRGD